MAELVDQIVEVTVAMFGEIGQRGQSAVGESRKTVPLNRADGQRAIRQPTQRRRLLLHHLDYVGLATVGVIWQTRC